MKSLRVGLLSVALLVTLPLVSRAVDGSWSNNADGIWSDVNNWDAGVVAAGTDAVAYFTNTITSARTVSNDSPGFVIGSLMFAPSATNGWTLIGNGMTLDRGLGPAISVSAGTSTVSVVLSGTAGMAKIGVGVLSLTANSQYSGTTEINQGTLQFTGGGKLYNTGTAAGTINVNSGGTLAYNVSDVFGAHTANPTATVAIHSGGLVQNVGAYFNTLRNLTLDGGELRANGGASATYPAFQLKGTVTVSGSSPSLISKTTTVNANNRIQLGDNTAGGLTTFDVADVTGNANHDLNVTGSFTDGRNTGDTAFVPSGFLKLGSGTMQVAGNQFLSGPAIVAAGELVVTGAAMNTSFTLGNGTMLTATWAPGLIGDYYHLGALPLTASFTSLQSLNTHLSTLNPSVQHNFPNTGTDFNFTGGGWPASMPATINYETRWEGRFEAPTSGDYWFDTASDDGSMIWIDGTNVVSNNFFQGTTRRGGNVTLTSGLHDIVIAYYQGTGGFTMDARVRVAGSLTTNFITMAQLSTPSAVGTLSGDAGSVLNLSNAPLTVAQASNGVFSGSIVGSGKLRKIGAGTLTLAADNTPFIGGILMEGGRISVTNDINLGGATGSLTFAGGILQVTGTGISSLGSHVVNYSTFNGGFDVADPTHTFVLPVSLDTPGFLRKYGSGKLSITNANLGGLIVDQGPMVLDGQSVTSTVYASVGQNAGDDGTLMLRGTASHRSLTTLNIGEFVGSTGKVIVTGSAKLTGPGFSPMYVGNAGKGSLTVMGSAFVSNKLQVGFAAGSGNGAIYQYGGNVYNSDGAGQDAALGWNLGAYGYYGMFGGAYSNRGWTQVGQSGLGVVQQFGGSYNHLGVDGNYDLSRGGTGVVYLAGGTFNSVNGVTLGYNAGVNGLAIFTVDGSAQMLLQNNVRMTERYDSRAILNLNGGVLEANQISKTIPTNTYPAIVNFNGGTLRARVAGNLINVGANSPDAIYVYAGGAMIDTTNVNVTIASTLRAPEGSGVTSIPVTSGGSGYIGSPVVIVSGAGTGATAVAMMDLNTNSANFGQVTNIVVTSAGVNYVAPTVALFGGGADTPATLGAPIVGANSSGGLTKLGYGTLTLLGTNSYGGTTVIDNGVLMLASTNSISGGLVTFNNSTTAGIGVTYPMDQDFINWLTTKLSGANSPGIVALGANSTNNLDFTNFTTNTYLASVGGNYTFSGSLNVTGTNLYLGGSGGTLTYAPVIGSGTNVFIGQAAGDISGAVVLSGSNGTYASTINVQGGTLKGGAASSLGGAAATVNVANGTVLDVNGQNLGAVQLYVLGSGIGGTGAIINSGVAQQNALTTVHLTGNATFGGVNRWDIRPASLSIGLDLAGFTMTKTNINYIALFDAMVSDGNLVAGQGTLSIQSATTITGGVGTITVGAPAILDFWNLTGSVTRPITINGGTISAINGVNTIGSAITLSGATNTLNATTAMSLILTGQVGGVGAMLKTGGGTVKFQNTESYTGPTIVSGGTLELSSADPVNGTISASSNLFVTGARVLLDFNNGIFGSNKFPIKLAGGSLETASGVYCQINGPFEMAGGGLAGGVPTATNGNWVLNTNVIVTGAGAAITAKRTQLGVAGGVTFDVSTGASLTVNGSLENPGADATRTGAVIKAGSGIMTLASTNSYSGPTVISAGTLKLSPQGPASGSALWLDASDFSTLVSTNGSSINQWSDKSGNSRHATQNVTANQPTLVTNALVNRTVVRFNGNPKLMNVDLSFLANSEYSIFAIEGRTNSNTTSYFLGTQLNSNNNGLHFGYRTDTQFTLAQYGNDINATVPAYAGQTFELWDGILDFGSGHTLYRNGTNVANSANTTALLASLGPGVVGCGLVNYFYQGDLAEVLIYPRALNATERQTVEDYLRNKWILGIDASTTNLLPVATPVLLASGATFDVGGVSQTVGSLGDNAGTGGIITNSAAAPVMLTIGNNGVNTTFSGAIKSSGSGTITLAKIGAGTQTLHGASSYNGGTTLTSGGLVVNGVLSGTGMVSMTDGTLGGTGSVNGLVFQFGGTVAPGASPGVLTFLGSYAQLGTLAIEINGTTPGSGYDRLVVGDTASLAGPLVVTTNGYTPVTGDTFTILTASNGVSGAFASMNLPPLSAPELGWKIDYQANAVVLSVTSPPTATGYELAALAITNGLTGYQDDADGDGYANLLEYVTGGNLTNSDTVSSMNGTRVGGLLALQFTRASNSVDATLVVEGANSSTNDANWIGIATNIGGSWGSATNVVETNGPSLFNVTAYDTDPATNRFLRLRITRP